MVLIKGLENRTFHRENRFSVLDRKIPLEIVPINNNHTHDLAVISSIYHVPTIDLETYAELLIREFGGLDHKVQVIFADNTPNFDHKETFLQIHGKLEKVGISFVGLHVSTPGKVHGLNGCLSQVKAPYVMLVDTNEEPAPNTLNGLFEEIKEKRLSLLSARFVLHNPRKEQIQTWNVGVANIGERWCFPGFPNLIAEDGYTQRLTEERGGTFSVSNLSVFDKKGSSLSEEQSKARYARWIASNLQLDHLTVYQGETEWNLDRSSQVFKTNILEKIYKTMIEEKYRFPYIIFLKALSKISDQISNKKYRDEFTNMLLANPELCTWDR